MPRKSIELVDGKKFCYKCLQYLPLKLFSPSKRGAHGLQSRCKICRNKTSVIYNSLNKDKIKKKYNENIEFIRKRDVGRNNTITKNGLTSARERTIKTRYKITAEEYLQMIEDQDNKCAICRKEETAKSRYGGIRALNIDHHHESGRVRGLLCTRCNQAIGLLKDDIELFKNTVDYLTNN